MFTVGDERGETDPVTPDGMARRGAIAAGHELTAQAGADVLRRGGNAVDAAIAAVAMACVCEPVLCSPGGGAFAMVRAGDGSVRLFDAFAQTPRRRIAHLDDGFDEIHAEFGTARQAFHIGPATSATPGLFDGLAVLAATFGTETLDTLARAAVKAARNGIAITRFQHHVCTVVSAILTATNGTRELFTIDGQLMPTGATFRNPGLADALEILATEGFSGSAVGAAALLQQQRGHLRDDDFAAYAALERDPLEIELAGDQVLLNPLPAAGGALIAHTLGQLADASPRSLATAIAATGTARREAAGDLAALASLPVRRRGTTHISVIDADGTTCSITTSNGEGNGELVDDFGFMLNNVLGEDDVNPDGANWPVDTRLSSMMCPTIIEHHDGGITALGSGGSSRIRSAISQVVALLCLDGVDLQTAVDAPRLHADGDRLDLEQRDTDTVASLCAAFPDHLVWPAPDLFFGGVHCARRDPDGHLAAAGDDRRAGASICI